MLETLLDGFIWRSRRSVHGMRRVNYYIKYLIQASGPRAGVGFADFLKFTGNSPNSVTEGFLQ